MEIVALSPSTLRQTALLMVLLWPRYSLEEMENDLEALLQDPQQIVFVALDETGKALGFAQAALRHDYVEGASFSPTAYLEGIFVLEEQRHKGIGRALLGQVEGWALEQNCSQLASDCEIGNSLSLLFHLGSGFWETNRIVTFLKDL